MKQFFSQPKVKTAFRLIVFVVGLLVSFFAGDRYFPDNEWEFWGLIIFVIVALIPQGVMFPYVRSLGYKHDFSPCLTHSNQCCVELFKEEIAARLKGGIVIDDETMGQYRLFRFVDMVDIIADFASIDESKIKKSFQFLINDEISSERLHNTTREIWFFSYEISTESFLGKIQQIEELKNGSVGFIYFYIQDDDSAACREQAKLQELNPTAKFTFQPIRIERVTNTGFNILPEMLGSIVYVFRTNNAPSFASFFVLKGKAKDSVYFRMPYCMNDDYYKYFASLHPSIGGTT